MRIIVTGSLAYDYIMHFPGYFRDHILPDRVHMLTVSFLVDSMKRLRGGVAGNIAYTLALLGERPSVCAAAGQDFKEYREWMEEQGVDTAAITTIPDEFTASCFINTDLSNNQIVAFYTGAMAHSKSISLLDLQLTPNDFVIISPTDPEAMIRYANECRALAVPFLFDPGKQTPRLEGEQILLGLRDAFVLVGNDYEFGMMAQKTGQQEQNLISSTPIVVITRGAEGSTIYDNRSGQMLHVPTAKVEHVVDPTGAGDAYLGGLVFGIQRGYALDVAGRVAALAAAYVIEQSGCQEHYYTQEDFRMRYSENFGHELELG